MLAVSTGISQLVIATAFTGVMTTVLSFGPGWQSTPLPSLLLMAVPIGSCVWTVGRAFGLGRHWHTLAGALLGGIIGYLFIGSGCPTGWRPLTRG